MAAIALNAILKKYDVQLCGPVPPDDRYTYLTSVAPMPRKPLPLRFTKKFWLLIHSGLIPSVLVRTRIAFNSKLCPSYISLWLNRVKITMNDCLQVMGSMPASPVKPLLERAHTILTQSGAFPSLHRQVHQKYTWLYSYALTGRTKGDGISLQV